MTDHFDRDEERIRAALHTGRIEPLAPESGHFDTIVARARHRRHRRVFAVAGVFVLAAGAGLGYGLLNLGGTDSLTQRPTGNGSSQQPSASATASLRSTPTSPPLPGPVHPSGSPSSAPASVRPSGSARPSDPAGLPVGGPVPAGFQTRSVSSVGSGVTYVLGTAPCAQAPCTSMARSTDGGRTWKGIRPPRVALASASADPLPAGAVSNVRYASPRQGWLYGGALYATHDGGASWAQVGVPGQVQALETDGTTAFAVVASCGSSGCSGARLMQAAVGSDSWTAVPGVTGDAGGVLHLSLGTGGIAQLGGLAYARTAAGWTRAATVPCGNGTQLDQVAAAASGSALFAFCGGGGAGNIYYTTYVSTDAGHSWHLPAGRGSPQQDLQLPNGVTSVAAASSQVLAFAAGNADLGGSVQVSTDGGASWASAALPASAAGWHYVGASGARSLVAIDASGGLYESTDAGRTWGAVRISS